MIAFFGVCPDRHIPFFLIANSQSTLTPQTYTKMEVVFRAKSKSSNRIGPMLVGEGDSRREVVITNAKLTTTDKEIVAGLLSHDFYNRGYYYLDTDPKLVNAYLANDEEPDYIDKDYLEKISDKTILKLGKLCNCKNQFPELIKNELRNAPITDDIVAVVEADDKKPSKNKSKKKKAKKIASKSKK